MRWLAPSREKQAWKAECIERCPLGLGKGSWKRANVRSTGAETVRFNPSRQPFWKPGHAPASYFMKLSNSWYCSSFIAGLNGLASPFGLETLVDPRLHLVVIGLNGLASPFGFETDTGRW